MQLSNKVATSQKAAVLDPFQLHLPTSWRSSHNPSTHVGLRYSESAPRHMTEVPAHKCAMRHLLHRLDERWDEIPSPPWQMDVSIWEGFESDQVLGPRDRQATISKEI
jgi:hypothetical protein